MPNHKEKPNAPEAKNTSMAYTRVCGEEETSRSCGRIVLVQASHQCNLAKKLTMCAVLDDQSTDVFIFDSLLQQLEVDTPEVDLQVNTIIKLNQNKESNWTVQFVYSQEFIPASPEEIAIPQVAKQW